MLMKTRHMFVNTDMATIDKSTVSDNHTKAAGSEDYRAVDGLAIEVNKEILDKVVSAARDGEALEQHDLAQEAPQHS